MGDWRDSYKDRWLDIVTVAAKAAQHAFACNRGSGGVAREVLDAVVAEADLIPLDLAKPAKRFPKLEAAAEKLGPNALAILEEVATRLAMGASQGDFDSGRDYGGRESYEEMLDRLVYEIRAKHQRMNRKPVAWLVIYDNGKSDCVSSRPPISSANETIIPLYADSVPRTG